MTILVTGSTGHLGEALLRYLRTRGEPAVGADVKPFPFTDQVGSISDKRFVERWVKRRRPMRTYSPMYICNSYLFWIREAILGVLDGRCATRRQSG